MTLTLHDHPFASFPMKVAVALYETGTPFERVLVNLGEPASAAAFRAISPMGKMPALVDGERVVNESSIIIEYLDRHYPGPAPLIPADPDLALEVRARDRFFDLYVHHPMQAIVGDRIRPADERDPFGVAKSRAALAAAYDETERFMAGRTWAAGDSFTMADCAAAPALYYADRVLAIGDAHPVTRAYLEHLRARPSFARVLEDARPYAHLFPAG